jgi:hypothetical protein
MHVNLYLSTRMKISFSGIPLVFHLHNGKIYDYPQSFCLLVETAHRNQWVILTLQRKEEEAGQGSLVKALAAMSGNPTFALDPKALDEIDSAAERFEEEFRRLLDLIRSSGDISNIQAQIMADHILCSSPLVLRLLMAAENWPQVS